MAISNRDRIQRGFELLAEGLGPFVDRHMTSAFAGQGKGWVQAIQDRDASKGHADKTLSKEDPALQLRMLRFEHQVFKKVLSAAQRSLAEELAETRNRWAHNDSFSADDTYRALDTIERLLMAVGAPQQADEARAIRVEHGRKAQEQETRKAVQQAEGTTGVAGTGLKPWREVLQPHDDVATGNFSASEFAADLYMVSKGEGAAEYVQPVEFFRRTFLTEGLRELLDRAIRRVGGDANASPIINLQTNFGGGKTHSMLALWHLFGSASPKDLPQEVQEVIAGRTIPAGVRRVALVGTHLRPGSQDIKQDGTVINTLWGELAWQLGGREAFDMIAQADTSRTSPGATLTDVISRYSPCMILVDEWVAYARQLWEREDLPGGTFDTQFTFAQLLTESVKAVPGAMLVISIPASHDPERVEGGGSALEVGGPNGQEALQRLQNVVRRVADQWRPASAQESFEIVRRRLFVEPSAAALTDISAVARQFSTFYAKHAGEFPRECADTSYEQRMKLAYPIHPELFDRLYEDWSTLDRFQRTRGVLRLMSAVVHALWTAQDSAPLIMPGSVPLNAPAVLSELTQYLPDSWKPIVDADIDGAASTPVLIDAERSTFGQRATTRRIARTIFIGSAPTLGSAHKGVERPHVWLGVGIPGDTVGNFGSALDLLSQRATYLYADGQRFWFDTQASIQRTATDMADRLRDRPEEVYQRVIERLRATEGRDRGDFAGVHICPESTADIPDQDEARLVILHPSQTHVRNAATSPGLTFSSEAIEKRGASQRLNRNMLVFLAPDATRMDELLEATREFMAWDDIMTRKEELNLDPQQARQAATRQAEAERTMQGRISQTFVHLIVPEQPDAARPIEWSVEKADGGDGQLAKRASEKLARAGLLTDRAAPRTIRMALDQTLSAAWASGHISAGRLWDLYSQYPYLMRMKNRGVLNSAIVDVLNQFTWELEGFALATDYDENTGRYAGLTLPGPAALFGTVTDSTLLVKPEVALQQSPTVVAPHEQPGPDGKPASRGDEPGDGGRGSTPMIANRRFHGVLDVDSERYSRDFTRLSQEIIQHLAAIEGMNLSVTVEIDAVLEAGIPDDKVRVLLENARALKFRRATIED